MSPLPVVLVGAGHRASTVYGPLLTRWMADRFALVGVIGRGERRARGLGEALGVPWELDISTALTMGARGAVVAVSSPENGAVARSVLDLGLPALLETPLALDLADARALAGRTGALIEVAEQNPRFPDVAAVVAAVRAGAIGEARLVVNGGAGYRYHAAAVARALLGRPRGRVATGQRVLFPEVDVGRGCGPEEVLVGSVRAEGGAVFQLRDAEAAWVDAGPWGRGSWRALGSTGEWADGALPGGAPSPILALPEGPPDGDLQATARCLLDWRSRLDGTITGTAWSAADGLADLLWIDAVQRSATLGGAPIKIDEEDTTGGRSQRRGPVWLPST